MGNQTSALRPEDIEELQKKCSFTPKEIKRLYKRFQKLDRMGTGTITSADFMSIPELAMNPLVSRIISLFDTRHDDHINFEQFVTTLSVFSLRGDPKDKLRFAFKVYDIDGDGFVSKIELLQILKLMVGSNLLDSQLQQIVDKTIEEADKDHDGRITFDEFQEVLALSDIQRKMTIQV